MIPHDENLTIAEQIELLRNPPERELAFWGELNGSDLKERYSSLLVEDVSHIEPLWDLSPDAIRHTQLTPECLTNLILYKAPRDVFLQWVTYPSDYTKDDLTNRSNANSIRRVIGHWEAGNPLTPPVFRWTENKKLFKFDGHHRTFVAVASGAEQIPFYCKTDLDLPGVIKVNANETIKNG